MSRALWPRKQGKVKKLGPEYNKDGIPYDYILIVDSGSKGSRLFVYHWLNPEALLRLGKPSTDNKLRLVKKFSFEDDDTDENDLDLDQLETNLSQPEIINQNTPIKRKNKTDKHVDTPGDMESGDNDSNLSDTETSTENTENSSIKEPTINPSSSNPTHSKPENDFRSLPKVKSKKSWYTKIRPGISSFNSSPQKLGNHHLVYLLQLASSVVPKSQHYRTPFFLHSTAGMRLLAPNEQSLILETICEYVKSNSEFFLPDCSSHINVIDGDVEGLYGWLSVNYMIGSLDNPGSHQHGKNHSTYGLLDMGGASTQVVFMPNTTEIEEHQNNLFDITLYRTASTISNGSDSEVNSQNSKVLLTPQTAEYMVYSDSFLGFGMYQAHRKYLNLLIKESHDLSLGSYFQPPLNDPCLPKGYISKGFDLDLSSDFTGESDFQKCLTSIFPVILNSTYNSIGLAPNVNCKQLTDDDEVSSCLLNDLIPAFDFEVNHFFGVSGYWDSITNLLAINPEEKRQDQEQETITSRDLDGVGDYDYKVIYDKTSKICGKSFKQLMQLNQLRPSKDRLSEEELSELCFKSSWILNFLHLGLGFPRLGIDSVDDSKVTTYKSLQLLDEIEGSQFTWTLGRAILYANDEYAQAFNNYTKSINSNTPLLKRAGYFHTFSKNDYHYGAEQQSIPLRPQFQKDRDPLTFHYFSYENRPSDYDGELKWYIQPHRWYGLMIFGVLLAFVGFLLLGKSGRTRIFQSISDRMLNWGLFFRKRTPYQSIAVRDIEGGVELEELEDDPDKYRDDSMGESLFQIDDDNEDIGHI